MVWRRLPGGSGGGCGDGGECGGEGEGITIDHSIDHSIEAMSKVTQTASWLSITHRKV